MICYLKYKDKKLLRFELITGGIAPIINEVSIINPNNLPLALQGFSGEELQCRLMTWLWSRIVPNSRYDLEPMLLDLYGLSHGGFGRMFEYQHFGALLSHYASWFDNYIVDIDEEISISIQEFDPSFEPVFNFKPYKFCTCSKQYPNGSVDKFLAIKKEIWCKGYLPSPENLDSFALTLQSKLPSWWDRENDRIFLCQRLTSDNVARSTLSFLKIVKKYISDIIINVKEDAAEGDIIKIDYTDYLGMDCEWVTNVLDDKEFFSSDKKWYEYLSTKIPYATSVITTVKNIVEEATAQGISVNVLYGMGIGTLDDKIFLVIMF